MIGKSCRSNGPVPMVNITLMTTTRGAGILGLVLLLTCTTFAAAQRTARPNASIIALLKSGNSHCLREEYGQAISDFSQALRLNPEPRVAAELHAERANAELDAGQLDAAQRDAEEAIRVDPGWFRGYQVRGRVLTRRGEAERAIAELTHAIQLRPKLGALYDERGAALHLKGDNDAAMRDYNTAARVNPNDSSAYMNRGNILADKGKLDQATAEYNHAIQLSPNDGNAYYNRATVDATKGDCSKAVADFSKAIKRHPDYPTAYSGRAMAYLRLHQPGKAAADLRQVDKLATAPNPRPSDAVYQAEVAAALNEAAWARATYVDASVRDGKQAVFLARRACELVKDHRESYLDTLAAACAEAGEFDEAIRSEQEAINGFTGDKRKHAEARLALYREHKPYRTDGPS